MTIAVDDVPIMPAITKYLARAPPERPAEHHAGAEQQRDVEAAGQQEPSATADQLIDRELDAEVEQQQHEPDGRQQLEFVRVLQDDDPGRPAEMIPATMKNGMVGRPIRRPNRANSPARSRAAPRTASSLSTLHDAGRRPARLPWGMTPSHAVSMSRYVPWLLLSLVLFACGGDDEPAAPAPGTRRDVLGAHRRDRRARLGAGRAERGLRGRQAHRRQRLQSLHVELHARRRGSRAGRATWP